MEDLSIPEGLDAGAVNLARSIRKKESGGNYKIYGDNNSSYGAYQWNNQPNGKSVPLKKGELPSNFISAAKEVGLDPTDFSPKNQDMVAYRKIKKLKDANKNVIQIAAIWNGGDENRHDPNYITPSGLPSQKKGVYDVPAYVKEVNDYYQELKNKTSGGYETKAYIAPAPQKVATVEDKGTFGEKKQDTTYGKIIDNSITRGLIDIVPGAKELGEGVGSSIAWTKEKLKGLAGGKDYSQYVPKADIGKTLLGAGKAMGTAAIVASPVFIKQALSSKAISSPAIETAMSRFKMPMAEFQSLSNAEKLNALTEALKAATASERLVITKAISDITPMAMKELGLLSFTQKFPLIAKGISLAKGAVKGLGKTAVGTGIGLGIGGGAQKLFDRFTR